MKELLSTTQKAHPPFDAVHETKQQDDNTYM